MLILSRNKGQKIMINQDIVISVVDISGDQVKIGIEAPGNVTIYREEIYELIQKQNKDSAVDSPEEARDFLSKIIPSSKK
ncbi:carbon storage regulator CsrA [Paenibacillus sp. DYY-L-2]|uniref:carbon storage regulator CsrA n=1 Tax=Paenibacillus sp. DYY-L-2 TaxID=3447013 RepID=UPI003F4FFC5E